MKKSKVTRYMIFLFLGYPRNALQKFDESLLHPSIIHTAILLMLQRVIINLALPNTPELVFSLHVPSPSRCPTSNEILSNTK